MDLINEQLEMMLKKFTVTLDQYHEGLSPVVVDANKSFVKIKKGTKDLQKDVLGYEMLSYLQQHSAKSPGSATAWEAYFANALEESIAAVLKSTQDDIERQCFISRIYCWYSDCVRSQNSLSPAKSVELNPLGSSPSRFSVKTRGYRTVITNCPVHC
jgi:hypothetical protein